MSTNATTTTTTTTTDLSLAACKGDTNVAERKFIDVLVNAHLELQKAEDAVRDNALAIKAAERALQQAQCQKGMVVCNAARKRKAVKEASAHVCDSLKSARQTAFKAGARGAGLFADMAVVRAMSHRVMVMKNGDVVEAGESEALFAAPQQPYTRELLAAAFL